MSVQFFPWKIMHCDMDQGLPSISLEPTCGGVLLFFWLAEVPLGHLYIPATWLPLDDEELSDTVSRAITPALGYHLWQLGFRPSYPDIRYGPVDTSAPELTTLVDSVNPLRQFREQRVRVCTDGAEGKGAVPTVSVIICTRERPDDLARCIDALQRCTRLADEILVVDNAPRTNRTRTLVERIPGVRYLKEPRLGLGVARNAGVRHATGEIIAFTDDDVGVHPTWVERLQHGFVCPEVLAITGLVLPASLGTHAQWIFEKEVGGFSQGYRSILFGPEFFRLGRRKGLPVWRIGAGANMGFRRKAFEEVGLFDERLGAGAAGCSEDSEFWYRLLAHDWMCRYDPTIVVFHNHRTEITALQAQMCQYMRGHVTALLVQAERYRHAGNLYRLLLILPKYFIKRLLFGPVFGSRERQRMTFGEILGSFSGMKYYLRHRSLQTPTLSLKKPPS